MTYGVRSWHLKADGFRKKIRDASERSRLRRCLLDDSSLERTWQQGGWLEAYLAERHSLDIIEVLVMPTEHENYAMP